jgi:transposase InsO family protein
MDIHKNARSCPASRALLVSRYASGMRMRDAAAAIGVSERRGWEWLRRGRAGEPLTDRSSAPHRRGGMSEQERARIVDLRRQRWTCRRIARAVERSVSTVARVVRAAGLSRLSALDPPPPPTIRYEWGQPGDMLHIDIKKLGRITGGGGLNRHDRPGRTRGGGWEFAHVCVDDATRLAYVEMLPDEREGSAVEFLERAVGWFAARGVTVQRVLTDNGMCYRSHRFRAVCDRYGIKHRYTRPYRPQTNGKAERFNQTLLREWSYAFAFRSSEQRTATLAPFLHYYNHHRAHTAHRGQPPISRLLNNVSRRDTSARPPRPNFRGVCTCKAARSFAALR